MRYQNLYNIVFSDSRSNRWKRHLIFWLTVYFYHLLRIGLMLPSLNNMQLILSLFQACFWWGLLPSVLLSYSLIYYLIPQYFNRKKYISFIAGVLVLMIVMEAYALMYNVLVLWNTPVGEAIYSSNHLLGVLFKFKSAVIRVVGNPPLIFGLFLSIKTLKNWHLEQLKTETLARENTNAELQLLKAQVHPHFLFNTLNNIYSFSLNQSPSAGALVEKLSDMLNYMIHECEQPLVPLEKEIKLIRDYMGLEKVRYGNRLNMRVEIDGDHENKLIAPLLMISFVENCFKHGASLMRGKPWILLAISIKEDTLDFSVSNSKPPETIDASAKKGIGLANVQKRLQLLYPEKHSLKIESSSEAYSVHLQVSLQQLPQFDSVYKHASKLQPALA